MAGDFGFEFLTGAMEKLITVTGLPRSGTAFVSMLLNLHPECISYHELASYGTDWRDVILNNEADIVADCSTYGFMDCAELPSDRRVFIDSKAVQSHKSSEIACRKEISLDVIKGLQIMAYEWCEKWDPMIIRREDVFTVHGCARIWRYCFGDEIPYHKIAELVKLNVQHKDPHIQFGADRIFRL